MRQPIALTLAGLLSVGTFACASLRRDRCIDPESQKILDGISQRNSRQQAAEAARVQDVVTRREDSAKQADESRAAAEAEKATQKAERCTASRPERLAGLQEEIRAWQAFGLRIKPHADWIFAHCDMKDTRGTLVSKERTAEGVIVRTREVGSEAEVKCNAPLPRAVTQEDVETIFGLGAEAEQGGEAPAVYRGEHASENRACRDPDGVAGVDLFVTVADREGQTKILALPAPRSGEPSK